MSVVAIAIGFIACTSNKIIYTLPQSKRFLLGHSRACRQHNLIDSMQCLAIKIFGQYLITALEWIDRINEINRQISHIDEFFANFDKLFIGGIRRSSAILIGSWVKNRDVIR